MKRLGPGNRGQATAEMALVLPILILILVGIVDVGRMMNTYLSVTHAAREALRLGITGASDAQVEQRAVDVTPTLDHAKMTVEVAPAGVHPSGSDLTVTVTYTYHTVSGLGLVATDVPLTSQFTGRVE